MHLVWDESQFAEPLITSTAESKLTEREQLSAHLHITQPTLRRREERDERYREEKGRERQREVEMGMIQTNENQGKA